MKMPFTRPSWLLPSSPAELDFFVQKSLGDVIQLPGHEKAGVYSRVSNIDPDERSYSIEYQPDRAEEYARSKNWTIAGVYSDPDRTGRNSRRPGLHALIKDIKSGNVTVVVIHRLDRIYRNLESLLRFLRFLKRYRVRLVSVTEQIDTDSWWGRLLLYVLGALAEMYVWQTSIRIKEIKIEMVRRGLHNGQAPLGYCNGLCSTCEDLNGPGYCPLAGQADRTESKRGRVPVIHPVDKYAVWMIYKMYNQGASDLEIADYFNTHVFTLPDGTKVKFRTRGRNNNKPGRPFTRDSIREMLGNPFYAGLVFRRNTRPLDMDDDQVPGVTGTTVEKERREQYSPEGSKRRIQEMQKGQHEALIPVQLWEDNQRIRQGKKNSPTKLAKPAREYLLAGISYCWECLEWDGRKAHFRGVAGGKKNIPYYRCATLQDGYKQRARLKASAETLETMQMSHTEQDEIQHLIEMHHRSSLRPEIMEKQVNQLVEKLVIPEDWYEAAMAYFIHSDGISAFALHAHNLRQELNRLRTLYQAGHIAQADYEDAYLRIERQLQKHKPSADPRAQKIIPLLKDFPALWRQMQVNERQALLKIMFTGLYFDADGNLRKVLAREPFDKLMGV